MTNASTQQPWEELHSDATIVDLHAHPIFKALLFRRSLKYPAWVPDFLVGDLNPLSTQTAFPKLQAGGVDVLFSTAYPLEKRLLKDIRFLNLIPLRWIQYLPGVRDVWAQVVEPPYFTVTCAMLNSMEQQVQDYNRGRTSSERELCFAYSGQELRQHLNRPSKPIVLIHSVEGGHSLEGTVGLRYIDHRWDELSSGEQEALATEVLDNLDAMARRGVAYVVLAHFYPNKLIMPVFPYPEHLALKLVPRSQLEAIWQDVSLTGGLTELGRRVVCRMLELGVLIDVSHATPKARQEIYALVEGRQRPIVIASHVGAYAINPSPYNLEDWEIKWIADHGGVVGVIFMTHWLMPSESKFGLNFIARTIEHLVKVGGEDVVGFGTDFDGADPPDDLVDESKLDYLTRRLYSEYNHTGQRKYSDAQIRKILGGNALRVLLEGWGSAG